MVFSFLFLFSISKNGFFSNLLFSLFFSLLGILLVTLLLDKFIFSKEKNIIQSKIQDNRLGKQTLIYSMIAAIRLLASTATRVEVATGTALTATAAVGEYQSDQLEAQAAETRANFHEMQGERCEAAGRPENAAHHRNLAHYIRTDETLRGPGGPIIGGARTALQEHFPNASTSRYQQERSDSISQTEEAAAQETRREQLIREANSAHNLTMLNLQNLEEENQAIHQAGIAGARQSNEVWRSRSIGDRTIDTACRAGRAIAEFEVGDSSLGSLALRAGSSRIGRFLSGSNSDSESDNGSSSNSENGSSSNSENSLTNDVSLNYVRELHFNTDFDPYSKQNLFIGQHPSTDFDFKLKAYFDSQRLNTEEINSADDLIWDESKDEKKQSLEPSKSEKTEEDQVKTSGIPKLERTTPLNKQFLDALDEVESEKREEEMVKSLEAKKDFFPQEKDDANNK